MIKNNNSSTTIKLLIAEDEENIRNSIVKYLQKNSDLIDEIYCADNGQEAIDIIFRYRPQIMLLDIQMPLKDGIKVMKETAAAKITPRTIIISGHEKFEYARQAIRYGAVDYLLKPCRSTEILHKIEDIILSEFHTELQLNSKYKNARKNINQFVSRALEYMNEKYPEDITLSSVASEIGITPGYLSTLFKKEMNVGFADCLNSIRIERACDYFVDSRLKTYEIAYKVGYRDEKYFSQIFKKIKGISPSEYRRKDHNEF